MSSTTVVLTRRQLLELPSFQPLGARGPQPLGLISAKVRPVNLCKGVMVLATPFGTRFTFFADAFVSASSDVLNLHFYVLFVVFVICLGGGHTHTHSHTLVLCCDVCFAFYFTFHVFLGSPCLQHTAPYLHE